jgi:hypothetical protein
MSRRLTAFFKHNYNNDFVNNLRKSDFEIISIFSKDKTGFANF